MLSKVEDKKEQQKIAKQKLHLDSKKKALLESSSTKNSFDQDPNLQKSVKRTRKPTRGQMQVGIHSMYSTLHI
jgi:hypothetical protein